MTAEARALGDTARDDRRNRGGEGHQEEELDQIVAAMAEAVALAGRGAGQHRGVGQEVGAVGDHVADEKIGHCRDRQVDQDLDQRVDLVLAPDRADFEKREAAMHGQHHHRAHQDEKYIAARLDLFHDVPPLVQFSY